MGVYIARFGVNMYTIPLWEMASGRHPALMDASEDNLAHVWVDARGALGGPAECTPSYCTVCYLRKLLLRVNWSVDCFVMQPAATGAGGSREYISVLLAGAVYDGNFGWLGRILLWAGVCTPRDVIETLCEHLSADQDALYGPEGCDIPWDYGAASLGGYASGWLGRQR